MLKDQEAFLEALKKIYGGTRKWGTVRLVFKRHFVEVHQHKLSKKKERESAAKRRRRAAFGMDLNAVDVPEHEQIFSLATITRKHEQIFSCYNYK
mgnify:CR=1 FL=1